MIKRIAQILCVLVVIMWAGACGGGTGDATQCVVSIVADDYVVLAETQVSIGKNKTVLDVLKQATRDAKIQMEYTGTGVTAYVKGIDNLYEFDKGPESGWVFYVNEAYAQESCGTVTVAEGDVVVWAYVVTKE